MEQYILPAIFLVLIVAFGLAEAYGSRRDISSDARPVEVPVKTNERRR